MDGADSLTTSTGASLSPSPTNRIARPIEHAPRTRLASVDTHEHSLATVASEVRA